MLLAFVYLQSSEKVNVLSWTVFSCFCGEVSLLWFLLHHSHVVSPFVTFPAWNVEDILGVEQNPMLPLLQKEINPLLSQIIILFFGFCCCFCHL
jgi:hypothetical protein